MENTTTPRPQTIAGPAGALHVDDGGEGDPAVVFLHSLAGNAGQWAAQLAHLRGERRALALELRGHGGSEPPAHGDYSIAAYTADVSAAADALSLDRFVLVGHSMGAAVAAEYAAAHPGRVAGLLLVDGAFARGEPTPEERTWLHELGTDLYRERIEGHWTAILAGSLPRVRESVMADLRATPRETVAASFRVLADHDPIPAIRRYAGPRMLVLSDIGDNPLAAHLHVAELPHTFVRGTGHWLQMDRPDAFNALLDGFLAPFDE